MADLPFNRELFGNNSLPSGYFTTTFNEARLNGTRFSLDHQTDGGTPNFGILASKWKACRLSALDSGADRSENTPGISRKNIFEFSDTLSKFIGNLR